jgi:hypothetical protein
MGEARPQDPRQCLDQGDCIYVSNEHRIAFFSVQKQNGTTRATDCHDELQQILLPR